MYFGDYPIKSTKWGVHLEGQWCRSDLGVTWQQLLLRTGVNYQLSKKILLTGGYGFIETHRYGDFPAVAALRTSVPIPVGDHAFYVGMYDEIFFNCGKNVAANVFDQNRAYIALGHPISRDTRLEVGLMEQTVQHRDGLVFEHNHTLQVAVYSRIPFGKRR